MRHSTYYVLEQCDKILDYVDEVHKLSYDYAISQLKKPPKKVFGITISKGVSDIAAQEIYSRDYMSEVESIGWVPVEKVKIIKRLCLLAESNLLSNITLLDEDDELLTNWISIIESDQLEHENKNKMV